MADPFICQQWLILKASERGRTGSLKSKLIQPLPILISHRALTPHSPKLGCHGNQLGSYTHMQQAIFLVLHGYVWNMWYSGIKTSITWCHRNQKSQIRPMTHYNEHFQVKCVDREIHWHTTASMTCFGVFVCLFVVCFLFWAKVKVDMRELKISGLGVHEPIESL